MKDQTDPATLASRGRFFLRVASQHRKFQPRDTETLPLFPLTMIMEAEGLLAADMVVKTPTNQGLTEVSFK